MTEILSKETETLSTDTEQLSKDLIVITINLMTLGETMQDPSPDLLREALINATQEKIDTCTGFLEKHKSDILDLSDTKITSQEVGVLAKIAPSTITKFIFDDKRVNVNSSSVRELAERRHTQAIMIGEWLYKKPVAIKQITYPYAPRKRITAPELVAA